MGGIFDEGTHCQGSFDLSKSDAAEGSANYWVPQSNYVASSSEFEDCLDSTFEWLYGKDDAVGLDKFAFTTPAANPLNPQDPSTEYPNQNAYWTRMREHEDLSKKSNWGLWTHYVVC